MRGDKWAPRAKKGQHIRLHLMKANSFFLAFIFFLCKYCLTLMCKYCALFIQFFPHASPSSLPFFPVLKTFIRYSRVPQDAWCSQKTMSTVRPCSFKHTYCLYIFINSTWPHPRLGRRRCDVYQQWYCSRPVTWGQLSRVSEPAGSLKPVTTSGSRSSKKYTNCSAL